MIPIVFCASLEPWANEAEHADSICSRLNFRFIFTGDDPLNSQNKIVITVLPNTRPTKGEVINPVRILKKPSQMTAPVPLRAITAPINPPIKAWDELLGIPKYQVKRFQKMAPIIAATITRGTTSREDTILFPIVAATAVPLNAPKKLKVEAMPIAARGETALVETEVAIALAVSLKPLIKSNIRAKNTMIITQAMLNIFDCNSL